MAWAPEGMVTLGGLVTCGTVLVTLWSPATTDMLGHSRIKRYFGDFPAAHEKSLFPPAFSFISLGKNRLFLQCPVLDSNQEPSD
jgi:hypothetical protein